MRINERESGRGGNGEIRIAIVGTNERIDEKKKEKKKNQSPLCTYIKISQGRGEKSREEREEKSLFIAQLFFLSRNDAHHIFYSLDIFPQRSHVT